jgi:osmoprotectant transport system substrate-binding protein
MIALVLSAQGLEVANKIGLGPTNIVRAALLAGQLDIYPEYTGNGAVFFKQAGDPVWHDAARGYERVKELDRAANHLVWLAPAPASNGWAIAVRRNFPLAQPTLAAFARLVRDGGRVKLAASAEFVESPGGLPSFQTAYGFTLRQRQMLVLAGGDTAATMRAAAEGISGVNAGMAYGTDGALSALGLVVLADDKGAQTIYAPAPVVREAVLARHPEIRALDPVFRSLTLETLQSLNAKIAVEGDDAKAVAADYLHAHGFMK